MSNDSVAKMPSKWIHPKVRQKHRRAASRGSAVHIFWCRGKLAQRAELLAAKRRGEDISVAEFVSKLQEVVFHSDGGDGVLQGLHELSAELGFVQLAYLLERVERSSH